MSKVGKQFEHDALRAISRSRGHLRTAENAREDSVRDFAVSKAEIALEHGRLKILARFAEAAEINTALAVMADEKLYLDLENAGTLEEAFDKVRDWMKQFVETPLISDEEDPS